MAEGKPESKDFKAVDTLAAFDGRVIGENSTWWPLPSMDVGRKDPAETRL